MSRPLVDLQRDMARYLRAPDDAPPPQGIEPRRLKIYEDLVYRNIEGFINSAFPVLHSLYKEGDWAILVRRFIRDHRCGTPLFLQISEEFLEYLASLPPGMLRPFEAELAHYEWLELAVDVAEGEVPEPIKRLNVEDLTALRAFLAPTARLASYRYAVHRIGVSFQPNAAEDACFLLVYRDRQERVQFMELSAGSARLLSEVLEQKDDSVSALFTRLADLWGMPRDQLLGFGMTQLAEFNAAGIVGFTPQHETTA